MKRRHHESKELELTTLLNIMVVLVSSLLLSAVFSKITIQELNMPPQGGGGAPDAKPQVTIEVILRKDAIEISDGKAVTDTIPKAGDQYDVTQLSQKLKLLKDRDVEKKDAVLLVEPDIDYAGMINVMDAMKFARVISSVGGESQPLTITLFPNVTVGDAP
jgi:biopolymer transport protein ExbD